MHQLSRRDALVGAAAVVTATVFPGASADAAAMPPVRMVRANGINLAVYEAGSGPAVVLLAWQMPLLHKARVAGVIGVNTPFIPHWRLWLHPDLVRAAAPNGRQFTADPERDPVAQMRRVYSPDMYVLMFQNGKKADTAMDGDPRGALRNSYRKELITSADWGALEPAVANMEYYGKPLPDRLPGRDVLDPGELEFYATTFQRTGFTPAINWYRNLSRNWAAGRGVDQTIQVPSLMVSAANDVVLRPSMAAGMNEFVPDLETHVVADCWHWIPEEKPKELNRLAVSWLKRRYPADHRKTSCLSD